MLLYDSDCAFCRWSVARIVSWDRHRRLRPIALQDPEAARLLSSADENERMRSWHLVTPTREVFSAGRAIPPLLRLLPAGAPLAAMAALFPMTTERLYVWAAGHRDALGRLVGVKACAIDP
jgi:predicted DCC family thiol-disulfide oxidoreductase YuxK